MYTTIVDKAGNIYEVHLSSHHKPPGFDSGMLLNASSIWVLYDNKWYPSKAKSQRRAVEDIKSVNSVEELMALWGVDASEIVPKEVQVESGRCYKCYRLVSRIDLESGMAQRVMLDSTGEEALKCYSCVETSYEDR